MLEVMVHGKTVTGKLRLRFVKDYKLHMQYGENESLMYIFSQLKTTTPDKTIECCSEGLFWFDLYYNDLIKTKMNIILMPQKNGNQIRKEI